MFKFKKLTAIALVAVAALGLLAGCGNEKPKMTQQEGVLRVGSETTFPPFEFTEGDKYVGFDVDLSEAIAKKLGLKMEFKSMGFDALIPALNSGNIDVAIAGMSITDERKKVVVFSDPYYTSGLIVMVKKADDKIKGFNDLEGKRIAVQIGTTGANKAGEVKNGQVTAFNDNTAAAMELKNGGADAVINDSPVLKYYLQQGGSADAKVVGDVMNSEDYGIAVKKGNEKLAAEINKALAEMKQNGEYDKLYKTWFGEEKK